jgi:hypothetical protein
MRFVSIIGIALLSSATAASLSSCGGDAESSSSSETTSGSEEHVAADMTEEEIAALDGSPIDSDGPMPTGPAQLRIAVRLGSEPFTERVELRNAEDEVIRSVRDGDEVEVPAGSYHLHGAVRDEDQLIDKPERDGEAIEAAPGGETTVELIFRRSRVRISVTKGGRNVRDAQVSLRRQGETEPVTEFPSDGRTLSITPGRYDARITHRDQHIEANGLIFQDGATQNIPIQLQ